MDLLEGSQSALYIITQLASSREVGYAIVEESRHK